jgi:hypothetical protein
VTELLKLIIIIIINNTQKYGESTIPMNSTMPWKNICFCFFQLIFFLKFLILNLFFIELSHSYDIYHEFGGLTWLAKVFFPFLTFFFQISTFNIELIKNYALWFALFAFY